MAGSQPASLAQSLYPTSSGMPLAVEKRISALETAEVKAESDAGNAWRNYTPGGAGEADACKVVIKNYPRQLGSEQLKQSVKGLVDARCSPAIAASVKFYCGGPSRIASVAFPSSYRGEQIHRISEGGGHVGRPCIWQGPYPHGPRR